VGTQGIFIVVRSKKFSRVRTSSSSGALFGVHEDVEEVLIQQTRGTRLERAARWRLPMRYDVSSGYSYVANDALIEQRRSLIGPPVDG
jgi:hypothetical protein